jgi:N-glycosylase/DNA lyase
MTLKLELIPHPDEPIDLRRLVHSHGWVQLEPFTWDEVAGRLSHSHLTLSGTACRWTVAQPSPGSWSLEVESGSALSDLELARVVEDVRWSLRLEESLAEFHRICVAHPALARAAEEGRGRMLRSPTVWEDLCKTLATTCTTWERTRTMVSALCRTWGERPTQDAPPAFPTPAALALAPVAELRRAGGLGYRARYLQAVATLAASGALDLEALKADPRPTAELRAHLLALPGIGPYAAANLLMLLGRYDYLPLDSWVRKLVRRDWFDGREVSDREILAAFEPFGKWQALVYWAWDWQGEG